LNAGYGPDYKFFTHRVGHRIGMDGHEWPYLVRGNTMPLVIGMIFGDEPSIIWNGITTSQATTRLQKSASMAT
jgi:Xaa-Pro dipeptidase